MTETIKVTKNQILSELSKSPHGKLNEYVRVGKLAASNDPEFFAHMIAWDRINGQIRDAKAALPIVSLMVSDFPKEFIENSLAALSLLNPRELLKAYRFALEVRTPGHGKTLKRFIGTYLHEKEKNGWERMAIQHRAVLHELYALADVKPGSDYVNIVIFGHTLDERLKAKAEGRKPVRSPLPAGSVFHAVAHLKDMSPREIAGTILEKNLPPMIVMGALGEKAKDPDVVLALIQGMTSLQLINSTKMLEKMGIKDNPALRAAYEEALEKASKSKKSTFKTSRAAEAIGDEKLKAKLNSVQEKQIQALGAVEGNWLVLGDKSGSMGATIEVARMVAGVLAKMAMGKVSLSFFDQTPQTIDVTNMAYDEIVKRTRNINAMGGTSIGCGLARALEGKEELDGIAIISDAQENTPPIFANAYQLYSKFADKQVPVYLYRCAKGAQGWGDVDLAVSMKSNGFDLQEFDLTKGTIDYYSVANLVKTMRTNRYSLVDEVLATPLLTLKEAFNYGSQSED
jgi:hypothetical protein